MPETIAELAPWPEDEDEVTVENIRRHLLVWAKVYECRLWMAEMNETVRLIPTFLAYAAAGLTLGRLAGADPAAALDEARRFWRAGDDGEYMADSLLEALDAIDPSLAEAVVVAVDKIKAEELSTR